MHDTKISVIFDNVEDANAFRQFIDGLTTDVAWKDRLSLSRGQYMESLRFNDVNTVDVVSWLTRRGIGRDAYLIDVV
jgi:hypothetical protein